MSELYENKDQPISLGEWIITFIITSLPIIGFIMLLVWAFGTDAKTSKKNWARAALIMAVVGAVISIILTVLFAAAIVALFENTDFSGFLDYISNS